MTMTQNPPQLQPLVACKCGAVATGPSYVAKARGWIVKCSNDGCPALVARPTNYQAAEKWNEMSTCVNK